MFIVVHRDEAPTGADQAIQQLQIALVILGLYDVIFGMLDGANARLDALIRDAIIKRRSIDEILGELDFEQSEFARAAARRVLAEGLANFP